MTTQYPDPYSYPQPPQEPPKPKKQRTWLLMSVAAVAGAAVAAAVALVIIQGKTSANTDLAYEAGKAEYSASSYADALSSANEANNSLQNSLAKPKPTVTVTYTPPPPPGPATTFSDGTYLVGKDIQPGTYKSSGAGQCYWARMSDASGTLDAIIANDISNGPAVVTISASDVAFKSSGCGTWAAAG